MKAKKTQGDECVLSNKCLNFVDVAITGAGSSHLSIYSCKYSIRKYTQYQLLTLVLLKEYLDEDYRDIVELVELMDKLQSKIGIKQVPHFTMPLNHRFNGSSRFLIWDTLHKFTNRLKSVYFSSLLQRTLKLFYTRAEKSR